ncbi:translation initiation factor IF-1 [Candidatus Wolfebacteria bacterium CG_4_10_14_0_2_um_filter_39_18]|uniref:Translation initiation factor IF-1 n=1 Tax=Candidatus Wolfebacteria bacterium CG_4_10_14_0_2_um_filter_39_18 TaxID=1975061 RepID=A0A2M7TGG0_9BACT|nr:MAG: translation initiation factor IF-1 [Candidatus Wolfebacteria bacterium CG_4_10_14_0_2_um_filter_39_18]
MPDKQKPKPVEGIVVEALPSANFKVKISDTEEILAYPSGKMRLYYIKVLPGDRVLVEVSDDRKRGRITRRL